MGGGFAAGRHRAIPAAGLAGNTKLDCVSCGRPVTTTFVVQVGRTYCSTVCAGAPEGTVPGLYLG